MDSIGERQLTPFVGRGHDVATLTRLLEQAERGSGQLVGMVGEPGMGKSRLLLEFRQSITTRRLTYLEGRCVSYGSTIPYLPVLDLVRQNAGIADVDPPETAADKLQRALVEVGMNAEEGAPYLLSLLGLKAGSTALSGRSPESVKMRTFEVLRQLTLRGSRRRPIVLGLEDLQWVDRTSEELLSYLADALAGAPILAIATYRPGYRPAWLEKSYATQIALRPLSQEDSRALVQSVPQLEPPSDRLAAVIVTKGEGNPFVLEELVRTVSEQRALSGEATVPDTIQGVLMDRIDRLPDTARRVLQTASVIGREVPVSLLQAVWESPDDLRPTLEELTRLEFLYEDPGATETACVFKHALTQEAVYASLLEASRRQQHQAVGLALERLYGARTGEIVELLAHHFSRSADVEKAVDYSLLAGEKAQRRWANAEALAYFEVALARLSSMPDTMPNSLRRIDAVVNQVEVKFALGRHGEQTRALEDIRDLVNRCGDARRRAAWHYWTGFLYAFTGGPLETAMRYCREAAGIADSENLIEVRAYADSCLAQVCFVAGKLADAMAAGVRALKTFEESGNVWWACRTLWILIMTANAMGEWERSLEFCRRALEHGRAVNDLRLKVVGWWRTGSTQIQRGDVDAGLACCQEALALSPIPFDAAMIRAMQGYGRIKEGDLDGGIAELEAAMDWFARSNLRYTRSGLVPILADGYRRQGKTTQAEAILREMLATARQSGYRYPEGVACRLLAACRAPENPGEATRLLDEACRILEEIGARNDLAKAWAALAEIQHASGDLSAAARLYGQALTMFEKLGTLDEVSRLREILGQGFGTR
jgi:tetratricopeptide (TPR) repeat protein